MVPSREAQDLVAIVRTESFHIGELERIEPKLCRVVILLDMDVRRLVAVGHEKEEAVSTLATDCRHVADLIS
jgi:hypothetical protein